MFKRIKNIIEEYKELKYLAYHDSLTGLLNRNWLYKNIEHIGKTYNSVYFIDINNLHMINMDGHTNGDKHIKLVVEEIKTSLKHNLIKDYVLIRYMGDEFILFTNFTGRSALSTNSIISVGYSSIWDGDVESAIINADKRMLRTKRREKIETFF